MSTLRRKSAFFQYFSSSDLGDLEKFETTPSSKEENAKLTEEELITRLRLLRGNVSEARNKLDEEKEYDAKLEEEISHQRKWLDAIENDRSTYGNKYFDLRADIEDLESVLHKIGVEIQHQRRIFEEFDNEHEWLDITLIERRIETDDLRACTEMTQTVVDQLETHVRELIRLKECDICETREMSSEADDLTANMDKVTEDLENTRNILAESKIEKEKMVILAQGLDFDNSKLHEMIDNSEVMVPSSIIMADHLDILRTDSNMSRVLENVTVDKLLGGFFDKKTHGLTAPRLVGLFQHRR